MPKSDSRTRCWNEIGIWGDLKCPKLAEFANCVKCPVYGAAGAEIFGREIPADYFDEWSFGRLKMGGVSDGGARAVFAFKCGGGNFALPVSAVSELATMRMIHSIPYRRDAAVRGLVNINGELVLAVDLPRLFSIPPVQAVENLILVCSVAGEKFAFAAESAKGVVRPEKITAAAVSDPWYVGGRYVSEGAETVLVDAEILAGAITRKHI